MHIARLRQDHDQASYLVPTDLSVSRTTLRRTMVVGSCLAQTWAGHRDETMAYEPDYLLALPNAVLPEQLPHPPEEYDLILVQVPIRFVFPEYAVWPLAYDDLNGHRHVFDMSCGLIDRYLDNVLGWAAAFGIPVFVANFMLPQADLTGRLLPRYDLRNTLHFVEELNRHVEASVRRFRRAYVLDLDRISASFGRRHVQDDSVLWVSHGAVMQLEWDEARIETMPSILDHYEITWPRSFVSALWAEARAMHRSLGQVDAVKLVVVDLDDTLWKGVSGDDAEIGPEMLEGWPLGLAEALMFLKKRGVLLAIASKNDEARIRAIWPTIFGHGLKFDDFAAVRINWKRKPENMADILQAVNLLPESTVFIDDNPVERAEMRHAYPAMRVLGRYPLYLRRILLWSSETQGEAISAESASRTQMIHAQVARERSRETLGRDEFLATLNLQVACYPVSPGAPRFKRVFELLNKTNQFNTTGRRWTFEDLNRFLDRGGRTFAFEVRDKFTAYGLVGVCLVDGSTIVQFAMSCRVNGLDVELAAMSEVLRVLRREGTPSIAARFIETKANVVCRDLWMRCGFDRAGDDWLCGPDSDVPRPAFIAVSKEPLKVMA